MRIILTFLICIILCFFQTVNAQIKLDIDTFPLGNITRHPSGIQPTHPLGLYNLRIQQNFNFYPLRKAEFNLEYSCANVWSPKVTAYFPKNEADQKYLETMPWHYRQGNFDPNTQSCDSISFQADGILRKYRLEFSFPVSENSEMSINTQLYSLNKGVLPFSSINSDKSIEWFHSNIYGGEDPFARKYYGFNKAGIRFLDKKGKVMEINEGDVFLPNTEIHYTFFPKLDASKYWNIHTNVGAHLSLNHSKFNKSVDVGISATFVKRILFDKSRSLDLGIGAAIIRLKIIEFGDNIQMGTNNFPISAEGLVRYNWENKKQTICHSFSINFLFRNAFYTGFPYYKENKYIVFAGQRISSHWHLGGTHLFRDNQTWNAIYTFSGKYSFSIYMQQDWLVNNVPDLQTGLLFRIPF